VVSILPENNTDMECTMNKRYITLLVLLAVLVSSFAGAVGTAAQGDTELVIWADETRAEVLQAVGDDFEAEYGVTVTVQQVGFGDIRDQFTIAGPAGEGPDIIVGAHDWLGELVVNGLVAPIDLGDARDEFLPAAIDAFTFDGELYGMPYAVENVAFVYNPELVETPPTTWEEVRTVSEEIQSSGAADYGYIIQENDPYHFFPIQTSFGGYVFGFEDGVGYNPEDVGIDNEGTIAAGAWLDAMVEAGLTPQGLDYDSMHSLFESGEAGMMITGPWALDRLREAGVPFAVAPLPGTEDSPARPFLGVQGFMVSAFSENPLLAQVFLTDFVATEDVMQQIFEQSGRPPAYLPVAEMIEDPELAAFTEAGAEGLAMPAIPEMSAVWSSWGDAMQLIIQQQVEADEAFTTAAEQIRSAIAGE
jgi:maltose/maltodextrin transport system substrate-binding protein/arabinogalactan oligomer/maltooligosaccharide transport system substrate-binding protein